MEPTMLGDQPSSDGPGQPHRGDGWSPQSDPVESGTENRDPADQQEGASPEASHQEGESLADAQTARRDSGGDVESAQEAADAEDDPAVQHMRGVLRAAVAQLRQEALFNFGEMNAVKLTAVLGQLLEHSELPRRYLETVRAVFAPPDGYEEASKAFENPGAVLVLLREPGAGRTFTAHALLADLQLRTGAKVGPLSFGTSQRFPLHRLPRDENAGYLLELPSDEDTFEVSSDFGALLFDIQRILRSRSSRLIVLTTPEQWQRIGGDAPADVVPPLKRPDGCAVAEAWLGAEAPPELDTSRWLADARIVKLLEGQPPSDVLQTVGHILKAERSKSLAKVSDSDPDGFNAKVLSVVQARTAWRTELLEWHKKEGRTGFQRNFLLVASLLRNATVAHVYAQTAALCHRFGKPVSLQGQEEPGVVEMVSEIEADLDPTNDTIEFARPGWDDAVLSYFWIDRPKARKTFLSWMADAPTAKTTDFLESFSLEERLLLANRVGAFAVRWAAHHRRPDPLEEIISSWQKDKYLWSAATDLVSAAAVHPTMGRFIHELLLRWSKAEGTPALQKLTVDVCAREFGRRNTAKALLRLGHAAGSTDPGVQESVGAAVRTIWCDPSARKNLFTSITKWCAPDSDRMASGRRSFGALATLASEGDEPDDRLPSLLLSDSEQGGFKPSLDDLSVCWSALLSFEDDDEEPTEAINLWMDAAHLSPSLQPLIFGVLRGAVSTADPAQGRRLRYRLRDLLYAWQPSPAPNVDAARVRLRHELVDLLDHDRSRSVAKYHPRAASRSEGA
ncbi:hypothetical protein JG491_20530 [Streptomyces sp. CRPSP2-6A1]|uniref:hypothetical protein n=1 Tax=Streptomyces sp. CRPSP2-6A1 TaxID=2799588 RepID=UPI0018F0D7CA|nr:hypothetical protein [Streptomyces sp. CRPSP2-6A1]MBJ7002419.1 hypothetical protein [Streptomyces sp. CRPSP2-6A1]